MTLSNVVIVFETEAAARRRLIEIGYSEETSSEIAVYLGQATDLPGYVDDIASAMTREGLEVEFVELDDLLRRLPVCVARRDSTILWSITDGIRYYRGSSVTSLARLAGLACFGSTVTAQHVCQDKFASLALASAAGLRVASTRLMEGGAEIAELGHGFRQDGEFFVKPNTLGAKIGIFADSRCATWAQAQGVAERIWERYRDRALIQPFVEGDDVRVSFMDLGGEFADQLGIDRLVKDPQSETGGAFMTMKDNETLSGARDTEGSLGGFGAGRPAAFVPKIVNLRAEADGRSRAAVREIIAMAGRLAAVARLQDYFSIDFRIDAAGNATFFEFEVCPAITIYDFQSYLGAVHRLSLGGALAQALKCAFARRLSQIEP